MHPSCRTTKKLILVVLAACFAGSPRLVLSQQSERPEGPWVVGYEQSTFSFDCAGARVRRTVKSRSIQTPSWNEVTTLLDDESGAIRVGGRIFPAPDAFAAAGARRLRGGAVGH